jgi:catalase
MNSCIQHEKGFARIGLGFALASLATVLISAATWPEDSASASSDAQVVVPGQSPQDLVDALHTAFGEHHARAVHAKGILLTGSFEPDPKARSLTKASAFSAGRLPAVLRFSDFTGIPDIPDVSEAANPRGFAIKVTDKSGEEFDAVTHSFNGFPVATSDEFAAFLRSIGASGTGASHPTPIEQFLDGHPIAKQFVMSQKPPPNSYATAAYFGVNALKFTNEAGKVVYVRYRLVPRLGEHYLSAEQIKTKGPSYLQEEIAERVSHAPVKFDWYAQVAESVDNVEDPSVAWPESRRLVKLGTITVAAVIKEASMADQKTLYLPGQPHAGIEAADPMLTLRNRAYPLSFKERQ